MNASLSLTAKVTIFVVVALAFGAAMIALSMRAPHRDREHSAWNDTRDRHSNRIEKKFSVQPDGKLIIDTDVGEISITGAETNDLTIVAMERGTPERLDKFTVDFSQDGNSITVKGRQDREFFNWGNSLDVRFEVQVPRKFNFQLNTSGGNIVLEEVSGTADGETSGGNIELTGCDGKVRLSTSGGNLEVRRCRGDYDLRTSGGSVRGESIVGTIDFETSGGNITLRDTDGKVRASTSGGNIRAEVKSNRGIDLETSGGNIVVLLPKSVTATVDATTSGGDVSCELEFSGKIKDGTMHGKINGGGDQIHLETSGGNIEINPAD